MGTVQSLGLDSSGVTLQMRGESVPGGARYLTSNRGITAPEPGRSEVPHWITTPEEARTAVSDLSGQAIGFVKIWVDDRNGQYDKLTAELYAPVIEAAHANGQKVAAHIFALDDAKGLLRAGVDAFAHSVRDVEIDAEGLDLFRANPEFVLIPNLPGSGSGGFEVQASNLAALNELGTLIAMGTDGGSPPAAHQEMADMVTAGMTPVEVLVSATRNGAPPPRPHRCGDRRDREDRGLPDPELEPARGHREHTGHRRGVPPRRSRGPGGDRSAVHL